MAVHYKAYVDGPFQGKPVVHPYHTVLSRLAVMGVTPLTRLFAESDKEYVERMNRTYTGQFDDILESGILCDAV
jgi:hypothetical protein